MVPFYHLCPHFTLTGSGRVDFTTSMDFFGIHAVGKLPGTRPEHLPFGPAHTHKQQLSIVVHQTNDNNEQLLGLHS
jgi:hypothetical protein